MSLLGLKLVDDAFPDDVEAARQSLDAEGPEEDLELLRRFMDGPQCAKMWTTLEAFNNGDDELWVYAFLEGVKGALTLPEYHYMSRKERTSIQERIKRLSDELVSLYEDNELDGHLVLLEKKMFNGFFLEEDFSESNRAVIDEFDLKRLSVGDFLNLFADRAVGLIGEANNKGKAARNVRVIRFVRILTERNRWRFDKPISSVVATAANAIFDLELDEGSVRGMLKR